MVGRAVMVLASSSLLPRSCMNRLKDSLARLRIVGGWSKECPSLKCSGCSMAPGLLFSELSCVSDGTLRSPFLQPGESNTALPARVLPVPRYAPLRYQYVLEIGESFTTRSEGFVCQGGRASFASVHGTIRSFLPVACQADKLHEVFAALFLMGGTTSV